MKNDLIAIPFFILFFLSPLLCLYFLIRKQHFNKLIKKDWSRKKISATFFILFVVSFVGFGIFAEPIETETVENQSAQILANEQEQAAQVAGAETSAEISEIQRETVKVVRVIDGDTIEIEGGQKLRYIGIDTPESKDPNKDVECFANEATQKNEQLVLNQEVRLEKDVSEVDKYGRLLRYVYVGDQMVNEILVREGYAQASAYPPDVKYQDLFAKLEQEARDQATGLWGAVCTMEPSPTPTLTPWPTRVPTAVIQPTAKPTAVWVKPTAVPATPVPPTAVPASSSPYSCNCSKTCPNMSSCEEAYYQLNTCGCSVRDGDHDGVPCESICPGG